MASYQELTENYLRTKSHSDYTQLYNRAKPGLFFYVNKIVRDREAADDIVLTTLIKMWTKIDQYKPEYNITTWLYRIARNEALGYIAQRNRKTSLNRLSEFGVEISDTISGHMSFSDMEEAKTEEDYFDENTEIENNYNAALKAIYNLKDMYKGILSDRLLNGMKYDAIASKYNLPIQTIKNRIRRGRTLISNELENNGIGSI